MAVPRHREPRAMPSESLFEAAVPVAWANRQWAPVGASKSLDDAPASPAASLLPGGSPARSLWVITKDFWYKFFRRAFGSWLAVALR